jgi:hypothetical protein
MAAIINNIDPTTLEIQNYSFQDANLIPLDILASQFDSSLNYIEYTIASANQLFQITDQNFTDYSIINDTSPQDSQVIYNIDINPEENLRSRGFTNGEYNVIYNFLNNEISSSSDTRSYYIKDISSDRTEVKIVSNTIPNPELITLISDFKAKLNSTPTYFQDFYLNFGSNNLIIANNILLDTTQPQYEILINLYEPLPQQYLLKDTLWVVTQVADPLAFNIQFQPEVIIPQISNPTIKGPNFNLPIKDRVNNSSNYVNYNELLNTGLLSSYQQILSYLNDKSLNIGIDYTDYSNFVHFSSAETRLDNFYYKIQQIEQYNGGIIILSSSLSSSISESVAVLQSKVDNIIKNFDGYEYYLYYESSSYAWPKSNSTIPYTLYPSTSSQVLTWFGSGEPQSSYYGGQILTASIYDQNNQDYLINTIPEYLRDDSQNEPYKLFVDMIGQHYDNIWVYYKDVTNRYSGDNRLDFGISKDLVADALKSFGLKIYQNNFSTNDLYNAFTGFNSGSTGRNLTPPVGSELITNYVTSSYNASIIPLDDINKEIYKRLYHNLPYLLKTKGTIPGLRALINCFGVPDTILRISEFGGRDKDTSTYDYFDQQFNYMLWCEETVPVTSSLILNSNWGAGGNRPESIQFRIQTTAVDPARFPRTQSIFEISGSTSNYTTNLTLWYTGSGLSTSSYSGSTVDPYYQYGTLYLDIKGNLQSQYTCSIYAPFFDGNWWSIMVNRSGSFSNDPSLGAHTFTLLAGSTGYYDGYDGNQIMSLYSSSTSVIPTWGYSGSKITFFDTPISLYYPDAEPFYGNAQEIRYWAATQSIDSFKDYIMNPQSIDYTGETTYANKLAARLPLGGDLYTGSTSVHPKITGSWATTSSFASNSTFYISDNSFKPNVEARFLNSPVIGLKGRVTDKIQIISSSLPTGSVISPYISIEQSYPSLGSESPDVNLLEVAFSPQNEINDDIINSLGYFNIGEYIGDPRQVSSSATTYPDLDTLSNNFFQKYFDTYDLFDYVRLIKYFDNSLFKMIQDFVPARTSLTSGVVIKQHILERNKYPQPQVEWEDLDYSGSINTAFISGSTGGTFNEFNTTTFAQNWIETIYTPTGIQYISQSSQYEFYDGELPGTEYVVTDGELNPDNDFKYPTTFEIYYNPTLYLSNITPLSDFLDINTSPNQGEIYLWFDTGSVLQPSIPGTPQR